MTTQLLVYCAQDEYLTSTLIAGCLKFISMGFDVGQISSALLDFVALPNPSK